jgi:hypothetical protein
MLQTGNMEATSFGSPFLEPAIIRYVKRKHFSDIERQIRLGQANAKANAYGRQFTSDEKSEAVRYILHERSVCRTEAS